jgi:hypothetical protein
VKRILVRIAVLAALVAIGCAPRAAEPRHQLTERERDSLIGVSGLYGGTVVTRALRTSDAMGARAERLNRETAQTSDSTPPPDPSH